VVTDPPSADPAPAAGEKSSSLTVPEASRRVSSKIVHLGHNSVQPRTFPFQPPIYRPDGRKPLINGPLTGGH